mgnify:CR=1 FL=1
MVRLHQKIMAYEAAQHYTALIEELIIDCLERIKEVDSKVFAWCVVDGDRAMETATSLEEEIKNGRVRSRLHGIPIGIKDILDVEGLPTRAGSEIFEDVEPAVQDSNIVVRLREAGAIILGKTYTTKFAFLSVSWVLYLNRRSKPETKPFSTGISFFNFPIKSWMAISTFRGILAMLLSPLFYLRFPLLLVIY